MGAERLTMTHFNLLARVALPAFFLAFCAGATAPEPDSIGRFVARHCTRCHDADTKEGGLDLTALSRAMDTPATFATWVKVHDRVRAGEMPPVGEPRPEPKELDAGMSQLACELTAADLARQRREGRARLRRLNRVEFENTLRDLLAMPALKIKETLPEDGKAHGFDRLADALDMSFVHMENYLAAVDMALNAALCPLLEPPPVLKYRYRPWDNLERPGGVACESPTWDGVRNKEAIGLIGMKRDETFVAERDPPPRPAFPHIRDDEPKATAIGYFRHEDADFRCMMTRIQPYVTGWYKLRVSGYSFDWDGKQVVPTDRHGALARARRRHGPPARRLSADHRRFAGKRARLRQWQEQGCAGPTLGRAWNRHQMGRDRGPFNDQWPPASHRALFGDLPVKVWTKDLGTPLPTQQVWPRGNPHSWPKDIYGQRGEKRPIVYVAASDPPRDATRLLRAFLRKAFRRPPTDDELHDYVAKVQVRLEAGEAFEDAMRAAYREATFLAGLRDASEQGGSLLDRTAVLYGGRRFQAWPAPRLRSKEELSAHEPLRVAFAAHGHRGRHVFQRRRHDARTELPRLAAC